MQRTISKALLAKEEGELRMCSVKSRSGLKTIVVLLLLSAVLASPCWSAAYWPALSGLFGSRRTTEQKEAISSQASVPSEVSSQETKKEAPAEILDSSLAVSMNPSQEAETERLKELLSAVSALQMAYTESQEALEKSQTDLANLSATSASLSEQLESLKQVNAISDAEYNEVRETLINTVDDNVKASDEIVKLRQELQKANSKNGTRGFASVNAILGFRDLVPTYGIGANLGVRIGSHAMVSAGADYMLGTFTELPSLNFSLDNFRVNVGIGWMF